MNTCFTCGAPFKDGSFPTCRCGLGPGREGADVEQLAKRPQNSAYPGAPWLRAPPVTQPPKEHRHLQHHWLKSERAGRPVISEWLGGCWYSAGETEPIAPEEMWRRGWEYHAPAVPPDGWEPK